MKYMFNTRTITGHCLSVLIKNMRLKSILLLSAVFAIVTSFTPAPKAKKAEINGYYRTAADYTAHRLVPMDVAINCDFIAGRLFVRFGKGGEMQNIKCKDIWGFMFKSKLFRNFHQRTTDYPCAVVSTGKIVYYENGSRHIDALVNSVPPEDASEVWGHVAYFSRSITSDMFSVSNSDEYAKFKSEFGTTDKKLFDCMDKDDHRIRCYKSCVTAYNRSAQTKGANSSSKKKKYYSGR
jgi:hypothetical protein